MNVPLFLQALNRGQIWFRNIISISIFITSEICAFISHSLPIQTLKQNPEHTLRGKKKKKCCEWSTVQGIGKIGLAAYLQYFFLLLLFFIVLNYVYICIDSSLESITVAGAPSFGSMMNIRYY